MLGSVDSWPKMSLYVRPMARAKRDEVEIHRQDIQYFLKLAERQPPGVYLRDKLRLAIGSDGLLLHPLYLVQQSARLAKV